MAQTPAGLARSAAVLLYSLLMIALAPLLKLAARFSPKLTAQLDGRKSVAAQSDELARPRAAKRRCVVFFCSSAGEFEQARPLIERVQAQSDTFVHVIFFSRSGVEFAKARAESLSYSLAPAIDSVWHWGHLFSALRPDVVVVVRHELWPAFLESARHFARLDLIDASQSLGESTSGMKRIARGQLLRYFDRIFVVSAEDAAFFRSTYGLGTPPLVVAGDTKYDRVRERAAQRQSDVAALATRLGGGDRERRIVLGSAHAPDVDLFIAAWQALGEETRGWQAVIAPHHVDADNVANLCDRLAGAGLGRVTRFSELPAGPTAAGDDRAPIVVVDAMGVLAEIYGTAALAFVGGAVHREVHNVLEPACHGLALAFGPFYKNSQEAAHLVNARLARVCGDGQGFAAWWREARDAGPAGRAALVQAVSSLCGATDRIAATWDGVLQLPATPR
jgi:3-deoxy-D-manno-octulosonic-acid transferase